MLGMNVPETKSLISFSLHASIFLVIDRDWSETTPTRLEVPVSEPPRDHDNALKPGSPLAVEHVLSPGISTTRLVCARTGETSSSNTAAIRDIFMEPPKSALKRGHTELRRTLSVTP